MHINHAVNLNKTNQEDVCARAFAKHKLRLDVDISFGKVGNDNKHPYIKAASWVQCLERCGVLYKLLGFGPDCKTLATCRPLLESFWCKYRRLHPTHEVFSLADRGDLQLGSSVPIYMHGDEGTTYKKDACFVFSIHSALGGGTVSQKVSPFYNRTDARTNFAGHALETRFLLGALLRVSRQKQAKTAGLVCFGFQVHGFRVVWGCLPGSNCICLQLNVHGQPRKTTARTMASSSNCWSLWCNQWMTLRGMVQR